MSEIEIAFIGGSGLYKIPNLKKLNGKQLNLLLASPHVKCVLDP